MKRWLRLLGSLQIAVPLLIAIAAVLAWGTIYEARFGTAAVQRFIYHAWWFQALLGFLAVNLALAAAERYPWQRRHAPFVLAHLGIILILAGGILGGHFGIEGQLIIPEGQAEKLLETPGNVFAVHQPNPGIPHIIPTQFETQSWVHEPHVTMPLVLEGRQVQLTVDRYYPDAVFEETVADDGAEDNPAIRVQLAHGEEHDDAWLIARDANRFGMGWGEAHVLFMEPANEAQRAQWLGRGSRSAAPRGVLAITVPGLKRPYELPVPAQLGEPIAIRGTPYRLVIKGYFPDFAISAEGPASRSSQPNNPAIALTLQGPEGTDAYLLFARHPDFQTVHGVTHTIAADVRYTHEALAALPPNSIVFLRAPDTSLAAVMTDAAGASTVIDPVVLSTAYTHPTLGYEATVAEATPRAQVHRHVSNRSDEVHMEAVHLIAREGEQQAEAWVALRQRAELALGAEPIVVEYRPDRRELPFTVKLLDFRKIDYPGIEMAAGFESDVELSDPKRGLILMRTIKMNQPLAYRGYHLYQSSYIDGPTQTTVLSVRNDPGTPLVYAGFLIVIGGVITMFVLRRPESAAVPAKTRRASTRRTPRRR